MRSQVEGKFLLYIKNSILSHIIQITSLIIISTIMFFVIFPGINKLQGIINTEKIRLIKNIENNTGLLVKYGSMSPLIVDSIVLKDVILESDNLENRIFISNVTIKFSLINIIRSRWNKIDPPKLISSINLRDGNIRLNFNDDWIKSRLKSGGLSNGVFNTKIFLKDIDISLNFNTLIIELNKIKGSINTRYKRYITNLKGKATYIAKNDLPFSYISSDIDIAGFLENNFVDLSTRIKLKNITSDIGTIKDLDIDLSLSDLELKIINRDKRSNFDYTYIYKIPLHEMFFNIDATNFYIEDLFIPEENLFDIKNILNSRFSGNFKGAYSISNSSFLYSSKGKLLLKDLYKPFTLNTDFNIIGDMDYITFKRLNIYTPKGYIGYNGGLDLKSYFPNGSLYLRDIEISENIKINSNIKVKVINKKFINVNFDYIASSRFKFMDISSVLYIDDEEISFQGIKKDSDGKISLSGKFNRIDNNITSSINITNLNLDVLETFENLDLIKNYLIGNRLSVIAGVNYTDGNISYKLKDLIIRNSDNMVLIEATGLGNNNSFNLDYIKLNLPGIDIIGRVDGVIDALNTTLNVDTLINDNKYKLNINISDNIIDVSGSYGLKMKLILDENKYVNLSVKKFPFTYRDYDVITSFNMKSALFSDNSFLISLPSFECLVKSDLFPYDPSISFSLDGSDKKLQFTNLKFVDNYSPLMGSLNINFEESGFISLLSNITDGKSESYYIKSLISNDFKHLTLNLDIKNLLLDRFQMGQLSGKSDFKFEISGDIDDFNGSGNISSEEFFYNSNNIGLNMDFKLTNELISVFNLEGHYNQSRFKLPLLAYNYLNGDILGKLETVLTVGSLEFNSDLAIDISILPLNNILEISSDLVQNVNGKITILNFNKDDEAIFNNKSFRIFNNRSALQVYSLDKNFRLFYSHNTGLINLRINKPYFSELTMTGIIKDGDMDLSLKDINIDASIVNSFIPTVVDISYLSIYGQLNINGTTQNPLINGLLWADTEFDIVYIPEPIEPVRINVRVVDNMFKILPVTINTSESGKLELSGEILLDSWGPENILLNMSILKEDKIPILYQYGRIISEVNIYAPELLFYWDNSGSYITGDLIVEDGEFYTQILNVTDPDKKVVKEKSASFEIDINVVVGGNNKLYWPTKEFPVVYATASPGESVKVNYKSVTGDFSVYGKVSIINGEVNYSGKPFILKEGEVILDLSKDQIDPYISILATKTVIYTVEDADDDKTNDVKKQVEVALSFEGGFFSDFKPTFSTNDATITEDEVSALIGLAVTGGDLLTLGADVADEILTSLLTASVEDAIEELIGVDDVKIKSGFISTLITNFFDANITNNSFDEEDESVYNLSEMINDTSLSIGHFITNEFFIDGTVSTIYDNEDVSLGVDFGFTLFTPHFQLGFSMEPKFAEKSYIFEPEVGISIAWVYNPEKGLDKENK